MTTSYSIHDVHPVGFAFRPTDEELLNYYLKNKLLGNDSTVKNVIREVDVCNFEPSELSAQTVTESGASEWFFFCPIKHKYANSKKFKRKTKFGFWKATGKDRNVKIRGTNKVIGIKKTLVYKSNVPCDVKTNWIIHEYHDVTLEDYQRTFVVCRLMKKGGNKAEEETNTMMSDKGESSTQMSCNNKKQETIGRTPNVSGTLAKPYQAEKQFPFSTQQSSISENDPEELHNGNVNLDYQSSFEGASFETPVEADLFVNSILINREIDYYDY